MPQTKAIDPLHWGASAWYILHRLSFVFRSAKEARVFYESLLTLLPCPKCRMSLAEHLKRHPFPTNHRDIPRWCVHLHNIVNESIGREAYPESNMQHIKSMYAHPSEIEWVFVSALADSHPGQRYITEGHTQALLRFLSQWVTSLEDVGLTVPSKEVVKSKTLLHKWLRKNNKHVTKFGVCSSNTCELRVGSN